jgi:hypothetical protein
MGDYGEVYTMERESWGRLIEAMAGGNVLEVDSSVFDYWLGVLPPLRQDFWGIQYDSAGAVIGGRPLDFAFAEGRESIIGFWHTGDGAARRWFCQNQGVINGTLPGRRFLTPLPDDVQAGRELWAWASMAQALDKQGIAAKRFNAMVAQIGGWDNIPDAVCVRVSAWLAGNSGLTAAWAELDEAESFADEVGGVGYSDKLRHECGQAA